MGRGARRRSRRRSRLMTSKLGGWPARHVPAAGSRCTPDAGTRARSSRAPRRPMSRDIRLAGQGLVQGTPPDGHDHRAPRRHEPVLVADDWFKGRASGHQRGNDFGGHPMRPRCRASSTTIVWAGSSTASGSRSRPTTRRSILEASSASRIITGIEPELGDWERSEFEVLPGSEAVIDRLVDNGVEITYVAHVLGQGDVARRRGGTLREVQDQGRDQAIPRVRAASSSSHFKGRVDRYEIWDEPDIEGYCPKYIRVPDYARLVKRVAPVIRAEHPEAKIVVGGVSNTVTLVPERGCSASSRPTSCLSWTWSVASHVRESPAYKLEKAYYENYPSM